MQITHSPGAVKRFGRVSWKFQRTFSTPLSDLDRFVSAILSADDRIEEGCITVDEVVFEPKHLIALLERCGRPSTYGRDWTFTVAGKAQVQELLCAALADWMDFAFVPTPKPFVIYADHDEYTTIYANSRSNLNRIVLPLNEQGFREVPNWQRNL